MYRLVFKKVETNHKRPRTDEIHGVAPTLPEKGKSFFMYAETQVAAMDAEGKPAGFIARYVATSKVQNIVRKEDGCVIIQTENSVYALENIKKITVLDGKEFEHEISDEEFEGLELFN